jgi:hypothetical protein
VTEPEPTVWNPISSAPCDDTRAVVRWRNGRITMEDLDHDRDPLWWATRGVVHWRLPTPAEIEDYEREAAGK